MRPRKLQQHTNNTSEFERFLMIHCFSSQIELLLSVIGHWLTFTNIQTLNPIHGAILCPLPRARGYIFVCKFAGWSANKLSKQINKALYGVEKILSLIGDDSMQCSSDYYKRTLLHLISLISSKKKRSKWNSLRDSKINVFVFAVFAIGQSFNE